MKMKKQGKQEMITDDVKINCYSCGKSILPEESIEIEYHTIYGEIQYRLYCYDCYKNKSVYIVGIERKTREPRNICHT